MIIENGTIEMKRKTAMGINPETGFPMHAVDTGWGAPIPCQYYANRFNFLAKVNGEPVKDAEYTILIEQQPIDGEELRLTDTRLGRVIGEFSIIKIEPLDAVNEIRLTV